MTVRKSLFCKWRYSSLGIDIRAPVERLRDLVEARTRARTRNRVKEAACRLLANSSADGSSAVAGWLIHNTGDPE